MVYLCRTISENQPYMVSKSLNNVNNEFETEVKVQGEGIGSRTALRLE